MREGQKRARSKADGLTRQGHALIKPRERIKGSLLPIMFTSNLFQKLKK